MNILQLILMLLASLMLSCINDNESLNSNSNYVRIQEYEFKVEHAGYSPDLTSGTQNGVYVINGVDRNDSERRLTLTIEYWQERDGAIAGLIIQKRENQILYGSLCNEGEPLPDDFVSSPKLSQNNGLVNIQESFPVCVIQNDGSFTGPFNLEISITNN